MLVATLLAASASVALTSAPAWSHTDFIGSDPEDGATLGAVPRELVLEFSDDMDPGLSTVAVQVEGRGSTPLQVTNGARPTVLVADLPAALTTPDASTTRWTVTFRVVSRDGHPVAGSTQFVVRLQEPESATSSPSQSASAPSGGDTSSEPDPGSTGAAESQRDRSATDTSGGGRAWPLVLLGVGVLVLLAGAVGATVRLVRRDTDT